MMASAALMAAWKALPGLLLRRLIKGVAVGLAAGTAITYLIELRLRTDPSASIVYPQHRYGGERRRARNRAADRRLPGGVDRSSADAALPRLRLARCSRPDRSRDHA